MVGSPQNNPKYPHLLVLRLMSCALLHCTRVGLCDQYNTVKGMMCVVSRILGPQICSHSNPHILKLGIC